MSIADDILATADTWAVLTGRRSWSAQLGELRLGVLSANRAQA
jgi:hypothetical protein